jgi:hypothetical protein
VHVAPVHLAVHVLVRMLAVGVWLAGELGALGDHLPVHLDGRLGGLLVRAAGEGEPEEGSKGQMEAEGHGGRA